MKKMLFSFAVALILFQSCTITPRYHSIGYQIEWNKNRLQHDRSKQQQTTPTRENASKELQITLHSKLPIANHIQSTRETEKSNSFEIANKNNSTSQFTNNSRADIASNCSHLNHYPIKKKINFSNPASTTNNKIKNHQNTSKNEPAEPWKTILGILGLIVTIFGGGKYYDGGGGGGSRGGGLYVDWTVFFAIASIVIATAGLLLLIAMKSSMSLMAIKAMVQFFTIFDLPISVIGFIKSTNDYYDVGKYLTIASWVFLGAMWVIGLLL